MLGQYQPLCTYHLPSAAILTVPIPNLPVSAAEKALGSLSTPPPFGGMKDFFLSFSISQGWHNAINQLLLPTDFSAFFLCYYFY
jgi:hypothetical protein